MSLIVRAITASASLDMRGYGVGNYSALRCEQGGIINDKYYYSVKAFARFTDNTGCPGDCPSSNNFSSTTTQTYSLPHIITEDGRVLVNADLFLLHQSKGTSVGQIGTLFGCGCPGFGTFNHAVKDVARFRWEKKSSPIWPDLPNYEFVTYENEITCKKKYYSRGAESFLGICIYSESGYEYPGPAVEGDCLSDTTIPFQIASFCDGDFESQDDYRLGDITCGKIIRKITFSKSELTWPYLYNITKQSTQKQLSFKNVDENLINEQNYSSKWTNFSCQPFQVYHAHQDNDYTAVTQRWIFEVVDSSYISNKNQALGINRNGTLIFKDASTNDTLLETEYEIKNGRSITPLVINNDHLSPESENSYRDVIVGAI